MNPLIGLALGCAALAGVEHVLRVGGHKRSHTVFMVLLIVSLGLVLCFGDGAKS